jgi:predicted deacylase
MALNMTVARLPFTSVLASNGAQLKPKLSRQQGVVDCDAWFPVRAKHISYSNEIRRERVVLPSMSAGTERSLSVLRFGDQGARPKAYFQASLHADEIPAMLVLNHLAERLTRAAGEGAICGEVVIVPVANPIGLAQFVQGRAMGRFALAGSGNFNRHFPDIGEALDRDIERRLSGDPAANVSVVRGAMRSALDTMQATDELDSLRHTLLGLAFDADIALDLHCDSEAVLHLYLGTPSWPDAADLSAHIGSRATLLATVSGGAPFDEAVGGLWWTLAERYPGYPIPPACLSGTVEYRGRGDVDEAMAAADADNLYRFLQRRGVVDGDPGPTPEPRCEATPLEGVDMIRSPVGGIIAYAKMPGEEVGAGERVAVVVDPVNPDFAAARTELVSRCDGILYGRAADRLARPGQVVCKVAGKRHLPDRHSGALLTD